jgi:hypothetical protein
VANPSRRVLGVPVGEWFQPDVGIGGRGRRRIEGDIATLLAGPLAEARYRQCGVAALAGAETDYRHADGLADYVCASNAETEAYLAWLSVRTAHVLGNGYWWSSVERLADALMADDELGYQQARAIILAD